MSDKDKFDPTDEISDNKIKTESNNYAGNTIIYSFIIFITFIGFLIGFLIAGIFTNGMLCVFEVMSTFTQGIESMNIEGDLMEEAESQYMTCVTTSIASPLTILTAIMGGFLTGYPSYNIAKKVFNGKKIKTMI